MGESEGVDVITDSGVGPTLRKTLRKGKRKAKDLCSV